MPHSWMGARWREKGEGHAVAGGHAVPPPPLPIPDCVHPLLCVMDAYIFHLIFLYFIQIYSVKYKCLSPYH